VAVENVQDVPVFESTPVTTATQDVAYSYQLQVSDPDNETLTIEAITPSWLSLNETTLELTGVPGNGEVGDNQVTITVTDGHIANPIAQVFTISVANVNDAPEFTSTPVKTARAGEAYSYTITFQDIDADDELQLTAVKPDWLTLTNNGDGTATLSGTPSNDHAGANNVKLTLSDGTVSDEQSFTITVQEGVGISDESVGLLVKLYPNPSEGKFNLELGDGFKGKTSVRVYNLQGQVIFKDDFMKSTAAHSYPVVIENYASGFYHVEISSGSKTVYKKIYLK
jgi:hypothetical protein